VMRSKTWFLLLFLTLLLMPLSPRPSAETVIGSTTVILYPIADAYVNSSDPDANYGSATSLEVQWYLSYAYLMFDLSSIPSNAVILSGELELQLDYLSWSVGDSIGVYRSIDTSWTELGITWNNKPGFAPEATSTVRFTSYWYWLPMYCGWNVTVDVQAALSAGKLTEVLKWSALGDYASFSSKEGPMVPGLTVEYVTAPVYNVHVESVQDTGQTSNLGSISIAAPYDSGMVTHTLTLPQDRAIMGGSYNVTYNGGYFFVGWETSGGVSVSNPYAQSTTMTISGSGTLRAVGNARRIEYFYDDGYSDGRISMNPGQMVAVRFTPLLTDKLLTARFYFSYADKHTIKVHVMDASQRDLIIPFNVNVTIPANFPVVYTSYGWFDVDLSGYDLTVNAGTDFYIGIEWTTKGAPALGNDWYTSRVDNRSWSWNGTTWKAITDSDYMIRAEVGRVASSRISCTLSPISVVIGRESVTISGMISPPHGGVTVTLVYIRPDSSVVTRTVASTTKGEYKDTYAPDKVGSWSVRASWPGDENHDGATSPTASFTVSKAYSTWSFGISTTSIPIGSNIREPQLR